MLYFSKIGNKIFNLENISCVVYHPKDARSGTGAKASVYFIGDIDDQITISEEEYNQLKNDINTACSLVKLQQERGEIR